MRAAWLASLFVLSAFAAPASAQPDLAEEVPCATNAIVGAVQEERFFCEPMNSLFFVQFEQFLAGLDHLEATYPDYIHVREIGQSVEGRPIKFVEVTNEDSATPRDEKIEIGYSASIHANEPAGREGMTRVIEDLAAGKGPYGAELRPILDHVVLNVWFPNPDSWYAGDYFSEESAAQLHPPVGFARANAAGVDLNREFPSPGWIHPPHTPMSEPESRAVVNELRFSGNHSNLVTGTDLHGMPTSPNAIRSIIPNQDYDFRRMVLIVDQLRTTQERVESNAAFAEWEGAATATEIAREALGSDALPAEPCVPAVLLEPCVDDPTTLHGRAYEWGARWDMIGYTDSGFTSDYLMLSPRSPTGGMGAVGTIVEFSYSHIVPDNRYVAKFIDMHVQGVREIVRTQLETAGRLETPVLAGTGPVAYIDDGSYVSSDDDPNFYVSPNGKDFDADDPEARFEFNQVPYNVTNLNFWRDLGTFSQDPIDALDGASFTEADLAGYEHLVITDQAIEVLFPDQLDAIHRWVEGGGHLFLTDSAVQYFDRVGLTDGAATQQCAYLGHSDFVFPSHPLLDGVDWTIRVTGEATATGFKALGSDRNYPVWGLNQAQFEGLRGAQTVGTTSSSGQSSDFHEDVGPTCETTQGGTMTSVGQVPVGSGTIDFIGGALPLPTQAYDHRYGLADYSVSAVTYWIIMNSFGGRIEWQPLDSPFVPTYDYDPLYGAEGVYNPDRVVPEEAEVKPAETTPAIALPLLLAALVALAVRRR